MSQITDPFAAIVQHNEGRLRNAASLAERIASDIVTSHAPIGKFLGGQEQLCATYGTTPPILRQALRLLEQDGICTMKRGPKGGAVVSSAPADAASNAMAVYLELAGVPIEDVLDASEALDVFAITKAADQLEPDTAQSLRKSALRPEGPEDDFTGGVRRLVAAWRASASVAANPLLDVFLTAFSAVMAPLFEQRGRKDSDYSEWLSSLAEAHRRQVEAMISGDQAEAIKHLRWRYEALRAVAAEAAPASEGPAHSAAASSPGRKADGYADRLAQLIRHNILKHRLRPGHRLGSEAELIAHYEVSRDLLRQAVTILERHSIARMKIGPGGGVIVCEPNPDRVIRAGVRYIMASGVQRVHTTDLREPLFAAALARLPGRLTASHIAGFRALRRQFAASTDSEAVLVAFDLRLQIVEISDNAALDLCIRTMLGVAVHLPVAHLEPQEMRSAVDHYDSILVEALADGDHPLAVLALRAQERRWRDVVSRPDRSHSPPFFASIDPHEVADRISPAHRAKPGVAGHASKKNTLSRPRRTPPSIGRDPAQ